MDDFDTMPSTKGGRITKFHMLVICLSLCLTLSAWIISKGQVETRSEGRFASARDGAIALIIDRMQRYEDGLWAGVAAVDSHGGDMTAEQWNIFSQNLRLGERYPGINGIGVIHFLTPDALPDYLGRQRLTRPDYGVFPEHSQNFLMPITMVEPQVANQAAIGLDVAHEVNRRTAALASRDTGAARITGPISLVQDADHTAGFLFYAPFYREGQPQTLAERQDQFLGAVYAPFVVHRLMEGLLSEDLRTVRFSITDGDETIYDEHSFSRPDYDPDPKFIDTVELDIYGRIWRLDFRTNLAFREDNTSSKPTIVLIAGIIIEGLIVTLLLWMAKANTRSVTYANKVTQALRRESQALLATNEKLHKKNQEIERFVYVASHDLKTPVRGITGLTEMLEDDLGDYMKRPDAAPEVRENLTMIHERLGRITLLLNAVLEFSRIGSIAERDPASLNMAEGVQALRKDFDLTQTQLRYQGDADIELTDSFNIRRVLENLIGNAIKYHDNPDALQISISAQVMEEECRIVVTDNGPGIDPKYHARIFDMFQTLRTGDMKESTGIGLSIVKKAIEEQGYGIAVTSAVGQGASFCFSWPVLRGQTVSPNEVQTVEPNIASAA